MIKDDLIPSLVLLFYSTSTSTQKLPYQKYYDNNVQLIVWNIELHDRYFIADRHINSQCIRVYGIKSVDP